MLHHTTRASALHYFIAIILSILACIAFFTARLQRVELCVTQLPPAAGPKAQDVHAPSVSSGFPNKVRVALFPELYKRQPYGLNMTEARRFATWNSGNIVWAYGAERLIDPALAELVSAEKESNETEQEPPRVLMISTANMLFTAEKYHLVAGLYDVYKRLIIKHNAPVFMVGVGAQLEFPGGFLLGSARAVPATFNSSGYSLDPNQVQLFGMIKESSGIVSVRGKLTESVFLANNLPPPIVLGCPSLFINHNPKLGATLLEKWNKILREHNPDNLRLAVGLPHVPHLPSAGQRYNDSVTLVRFIAENIFKVFPKSFAVFQTPLDSDVTLKRLRDYGVDLGPNRTKYFYDAAHWIEGIRNSADFLFGFRIHGTMAGVAAEVPGIVISTDFRIKELAEEMALPTVTLQNPLFDKKPFNLFKFMESVRFNGSRFDERRRQLAQGYEHIFDRLGLPLHPGVKRIAS